MAKHSTKAIAVIGDLINSKQIKKRFEFQKRFARKLEELGGQQRIASPYTLTLAACRACARQAASQMSGISSKRA